MLWNVNESGKKIMRISITDEDKSETAGECEIFQILRQRGNILFNMYTGD
jgi:hypothetical protein